MRYSKKKFREFLDENLKANAYDFDAACRELEDQYRETGRREYEISSYETKSGHPETFRY